MLLLVDDLFGRKCRERLRIPVHHAHSTINQPLVVEVHKHLDDALRAHLVHREGRALPVARRAQLPQLLQDDAAVLVCPVPRVFQEFLARQVAFLDALFREFLHHFRLRCNRGVVGAGHPAGVLALHAGASHQNVLNRVVEHVAHVEHARHVGWRNHNCVGFSAVGL